MKIENEKLNTAVKGPKAKITKRTHLTRSVTPDRACPGLDPGIRGPEGSVARDWVSSRWFLKSDR